MEEVAASSLTGSNVDLGLSWSSLGRWQVASSPRSSFLFLLQLINLPPRNATEHRDDSRSRRQTGFLGVDWGEWHGEDLPGHMIG